MGQPGELLGKPLPGEPLEALRRLTRIVDRPKRVCLVALMSVGKLFYEHLEELMPEDMPARIDAERLRTTWLKERQDVWIAPPERGLCRTP